MYTMYVPGGHSCQMRGFHPLELESGTIVSHRMGTGIPSLCPLQEYLMLLASELSLLPTKHMFI